MEHPTTSEIDVKTQRDQFRSTLPCTLPHRTAPSLPLNLRLDSSLSTILENVFPEGRYRFDRAISTIRTNMSEWVWLKFLTQKNPEDAMDSLRGCVKSLISVRLFNIHALRRQLHGSFRETENSAFVQGAGSSFGASTDFYVRERSTQPATITLMI